MKLTAQELGLCKQSKNASASINCGAMDERKRIPRLRENGTGRKENQLNEKKLQPMELGGIGASRHHSRITIERTNVCLTCVRSSNINQM